MTLDDAVVKLLLAHEDTNPDFQHLLYKRRALQLAAEKGYKGIVRLLFAYRGVKPDVYGSKESSLNLATQKGHIGIIHLPQAHKSNNKT